MPARHSPDATVQAKLDQQLFEAFPKFKTLTEFFLTSNTQPDPSYGSHSIIIEYDADKEHHRAPLIKFCKEARWLQEFLAQESVRFYVLPGLWSRASGNSSDGAGTFMHAATCSVLMSSSHAPWGGASLDTDTGHQQVFGGWILVNGSFVFGPTTRHGFEP
jgi:hypothetical protein